MATVDATALLAGLEEYYRRLELHIHQMEQEYQRLETRWHAFDVVYAGNAAEQFRRGWQRTTESFSEYVNQSRNIMHVLDQRIASLREANRSEGGI